MLAASRICVFSTSASPTAGLRIATLGAFAGTLSRPLEVADPVRMPSLATTRNFALRPPGSCRRPTS